MDEEEDEEDEESDDDESEDDEERRPKKKHRSRGHGFILEEAGVKYILYFKSVDI